MKKIAVLGVTGSVGDQALDIVREFKNELSLVCISAHYDTDGLAAAANEFRPKVVSLTAADADVEKLKKQLQYQPQIISGDQDALEKTILSTEIDMVVLAVLGIAGLPAFAECLENHIPVALANKESLVCGADVIREMMDRTKTPVIPVDSEHSAVFQCLGHSFDITNVNKIWLTASGGPFLYMSKDEIDCAPLKKALKHPNWDMGSKITIDSASLANKGLEVIEAHYMYRAPADMIEVVIQPQSLIHSMVEMIDTSVLAQFAPIDMRLPLQKAMLFPEMSEFTVNTPLNFKKLGTIEFIEPDVHRFPCLQLAYDAIHHNSTAVYNIANEVAVDWYLREKISFGEISQIIEDMMCRFVSEKSTTVEEILDLDERVRDYLAKEYKK